MNVKISPVAISVRTNYTVRKKSMITHLTAPELPKLVPLWKSYALAHAPYDLAFSIREEPEEDFVAYLTSVWLAPGHHVFVHSEDGGPDGFIHFATADLPYPHKSLRHGLVEALYVCPASRRRRVGSNLLHYMEAWLNARSISRIHLNVAYRNTEAMHFWKKIGFDELTVTLKKKEK
jgi:GNAT superfamily N-acetyltransferase